MLAQGREIDSDRALRAREVCEGLAGDGFNRHVLPRSQLAQAVVNILGQIADDERGHWIWLRLLSLDIDFDARAQLKTQHAMASRWPDSA